ncbi:MAG: zinc-dependent alcohol dehydrogenase family protein [Methyloligellaceae bacterium]
MKGVVFTGNRELELREFPDPAPAEDEVVIEIKASGMCGSDLHVYRSPDGEGATFIAGHEPCGVVLERGSAVQERFAPAGARVMVHHYDGCRTCSNCLQGWTQLCDTGSVVYGRTGHGAHARYMKIPARTLVPLPEALSFDEGAAVSCGTGTAYGAIKRMLMQGGATLAVIGQGPVGLSATMLGAAMGARVLAVDVQDDRLQRATEFGADVVINAARDDAVERIKELTLGLGAEYAMECCGLPEPSVTALRSVRTWGTVCFVGMGPEVTYNVAADIIRKQLTIVGSWTFSATGQKECADFIAERRLPVGDLFTHRFDLKDAEEAYKLFDTQTTGKGVILPN